MLLVLQRDLITGSRQHWSSLFLTQIVAQWPNNVIITECHRLPICLNILGHFTEVMAKGNTDLSHLLCMFCHALILTYL